MSEHFQPRRIFSYLFIFAIAVLFALQWGPGARGCDTPLGQQSNEVAATVNGKEIPLRDFQMAYSSQLAALRQQGNPIPEELARQFGLHTQVLDQLVARELLAQAAERNGIMASNSELKDLIHQHPDFQKDGRFDLQRYRDVLRDYYRRTDVDFENDLRRQLAASKIQAMVESAALVSDDEVKARYLKEHNRAKATFVRFLPTMYQDQVPAPSDADVQSFAAQNQQAIADDYEANRFRYHQAEQVRARHILLKVDASAPADKKEEVKKKLEEVRAQIVAGKDFAEAAKEVSEDVGSKEGGGDLGFNERGSWVPAFSEAAFALGVGEVSQPVETQFGFHLIKVEEKKPPVTKKLEDVSLEIARDLYKKAKAKELASSAAGKALEAVKAGKKLTELYPPSEDTQTKAYRFEVATKPEAVDTGEFSASTESLPQLGPAPELVKDIFAKNAPGTMDKPYLVGEGVVVAVVTERSLPSEEAFTAQKDSLRKEAMQAKQFELRDAFVKSLRQSGSVVINDQALSTPSGS